MLILTLINMVLFFAQSAVSFPFSATIPQYVLGFGYGFYTASDSAVALVLGIVLSVFLLGIYLPFYFLTKKHPSLLLVPLIMFILDTAFILWLTAISFDVSMLIDVAFHLWVLFYLVLGVYAAYKIRRLPPEAFAPPQPMPSAILYPEIPTAEVPVSFEEQSAVENTAPETIETNTDSTDAS